MYTTNVKDRYRCRNPSTARAILNPQSCDKERRRHWAQLIQKVYEVDPLLCSRCEGPMRVIAFIEQADVICKILKHLVFVGSATQAGVACPRPTNRHSFARYRWCHPLSQDAIDRYRLSCGRLFLKWLERAIESYTLMRRRTAMCATRND